MDLNCPHCGSEHTKMYRVIRKEDTSCKKYAVLEKLWACMKCGSGFLSEDRMTEADFRALFDPGTEAIGKNIDYIIDKVGKPFSFGSMDYGVEAAQWKVGNVVAIVWFQSKICTQVTVLPEARPIRMNTIEYRHDFPLDPVDVVRVFNASGITRPTDDLPRIARMFAAPGLVISAWQDELLVGVSRALTDYSYCCYLSDLAVDKAFQGKGIGRELIKRTQATIGEGVSLILLSAPDAMTYYPAVGFQQAENAFIIKRKG